MPTVERLLLYATALLAVGNFVTSTLQKSQQVVASSPVGQADCSGMLAELEDLRARVALRPEFPPSSAPPILPLSEPAPLADRPSPTFAPVEPQVATADEKPRQLAVYDKEGHPRIVLAVDTDGRPSLELLDERQEAKVTLSLNGALTELSMGDSRAPLTISSVDGGRTALQLSGDAGKLAVELTGDGELQVLLDAGLTGRGQMLLTKEGEVRMFVGKGDETAGTTLSSLPTGESTLQMRAGTDAAGPVIRTLPDGLSEIAIHNGTLQSGPTLLRTPDGVSIISLRNNAGQPVSSMVAAPDGSAVIAVQTADGSKRAEMRIDAQGNPIIGRMDVNDHPPAPPRVKPRSPAASRPQQPSDEPAEERTDKAQTPSPP